MRLLIIMAMALMVSSCATKSSVYKWLDNNRGDASKYCAVEFPVRSVQGEEKIVRVVDTLIEEKIVVDSVDCPDGSRVEYRSKIQYVVRNVDKLRIDTVENTAESEKERIRANDAERAVAVKDGQLINEKNKAKSRLYWIWGLGAACVILIVFTFRKVFL